ncbi:MAG TPA: class I SAM-dependent methyltransferase [Candidatus Dormibacteraeota bacterium]|nr:class I SAM-dependent methyltransferase [Candidatus Dormibacteraeota bacterium]
MLTDERKEWNATAYHAVSDPQFRWGLEVLERVQLRGDETILDAGCGTGRLTAKLAERLPSGRVLACDLSENMVGVARDFLAPQFGERVKVFAADMAHLDLDAAVDGVFSTAAFHWVHDHQALFASLFRALQPGGWIVAQCGGGANLARLYARVAQLQKEPFFAEYFQNYQDATHFTTPAKTTKRLRHAGFHDPEAYLTLAPTPFADANSFRAFITTVCVAKHLKELPAELHDAFLDPLVAAAAHDHPPFTLDYQRLNLSARKPA